MSIFRGSSHLRPPSRTRTAAVILGSSALLLLAACGGEVDGSATDTEASAPPASVNQGGSAGTARSGASTNSEDSAGPVTVEVETGFNLLGVGKDLEVAGKVQPKQGEIITPSGTVEINQIQEIESLTPAQAGLPTADKLGDPIQAYVPMEGEVFRLIDITYTPVEEENPYSGDPVPTSDLAVDLTGSQTHVAELGRQAQSLRLLVATPEDGSGKIVVSSESHDQFASVLTGEREDDEISAAYYLSNTRQELNHKFQIDPKIFPTVRTYDKEPGREITASIDLQVVSVELTAWTESEGWAEPGQAWLKVDWTQEVTLKDGTIPKIESLQAKLSVKVDGAEGVDDFQESEAYSITDGEETFSLSVPIDTKEATISVDGIVAVAESYGSGMEISEEHKSAEFVSEQLSVPFG